MLGPFNFCHFVFTLYVRLVTKYFLENMYQNTVHFILANLCFQIG